MATRSNSFTLRLDAREVAMLRQLAKAYGGTKTDVMRELVRDAYQNKLPELTTGAGFGFSFVAPQPGARRAVPCTPPTASAGRSKRKRQPE
jgi:hypothetical protein